MNLSRQHKPVAVYVAPKSRFITVKVFDDVEHVLAEGDSKSVERIVSGLHLVRTHERSARLRTART